MPELEAGSRKNCCLKRFLSDLAKHRFRSQIFFNVELSKFVGNINICLEKINTLKYLQDLNLGDGIVDNLPGIMVQQNEVTVLIASKVLE